jgi:MFS family permease
VWLVALCRYLGYGILGGAGWGLGYISPVSTMMKWFPDRRGLAAGLGLTAFGGGAMVAAPLNEALFHYYQVPSPS